MCSLQQVNVNRLGKFACCPLWQLTMTLAVYMAFYNGHMGALMHYLRLMVHLCPHVFLSIEVTRVVSMHAHLPTQNDGSIIF